MVRGSAKDFLSSGRVVAHFQKSGKVAVEREKLSMGVRDVQMRLSPLAKMLCRHRSNSVPEWMERMVLAASVVMTGHHVIVASGVLLSLVWMTLRVERSSWGRGNCCRWY